MSSRYVLFKVTWVERDHPDAKKHSGFTVKFCDKNVYEKHEKTEFGDMYLEFHKQIELDESTTRSIEIQEVTPSEIEGKLPASTDYTVMKDGVIWRPGGRRQVCLRGSSRDRVPDGGVAAKGFVNDDGDDDSAFLRGTCGLKDEGLAPKQRSMRNVDIADCTIVVLPDGIAKDKAIGSFCTLMYSFTSGTWRLPRDPEYEKIMHESQPVSITKCVNGKFLVVVRVSDDMLDDSRAYGYIIKFLLNEERTVLNFAGPRASTLIDMHVDGLLRRFISNLIQRMMPVKESL